MEDEQARRCCMAALDNLVLADLRQLIDTARQRVAVTVNAELTLLYWRIGRRIDTEILGGEPLKRDFYIEVSRLEHWSVRQLQERIQSMLYERTAISNAHGTERHQSMIRLIWVAC